MSGGEADSRVRALYAVPAVVGQENGPDVAYGSMMDGSSALDVSPEIIEEEHAAYPEQTSQDVDMVFANVADLDEERARRRPTHTENTYGRHEVVSGRPSKVRYIGHTAIAGDKPHEAAEARPIDDDDRSLTEVDHLNRHRLPDGSHSKWAWGEVLKNQVTAVKEAAIPHAVSKIYQEYKQTGELDVRGRPIWAYMWLGKTAVQVARSGYLFHRHEEARARVGVEVDEVEYDDLTMRKGHAKILISPKDARLKDEHLGEDDSLRISYPDVDKNGRIKGKILESILVKDVPLEAWEAFLEDPNNIWGKAIRLEKKGSALSVMKTHRELEIPLGRLPEGVVSLLAAVVPYITDKQARESVERQLVLFRGDQEAIDRQATSVANRWMEFEKMLADSLNDQRATHQIEMFIDQLQAQWSDKDIQLFSAHRLHDGSLYMSRTLAARLEQAKQNLLWTAVGVLVGNVEVLSQLDEETARQIYEREVLIQNVDSAGFSAEEISKIEVKNNQEIAKHNVSVGGGCPGRNSGDFREDGESESGGKKKKERGWNIKRGKCRIKSCPNHNKIVNVGPCDVCMDRCQKIYDEGGDPS